jgi:hypothetical protein
MFISPGPQQNTHTHHAPLKKSIFGNIFALRDHIITYKYKKPTHFYAFSIYFSVL